MLDIRLIREKPDFVRERLATRGGGDERNIDELLQIDGKRRKAETALQQLNADRKRLSKEIGAKRGRAETTAELEAQVRGSRHAWDMRLISTDALIKLVQLKEGAEGPETGRQHRECGRAHKMVQIQGTGFVQTKFATICCQLTT